MDKEWKLGKDLFLSDCILDPITFDEIVTALRCNCTEINESSVRQTAREILQSKMEDYYYLLARNTKEIIAEVKKQKGIE